MQPFFEQPFLKPVPISLIFSGNSEPSLKPLEKKMETEIEMLSNQPG